MVREIRANDYPDVRAWSEDYGGSPDFVDFLSERLSLADWISISEVFCPVFIEVNGCFLWERSFDPSVFESWWLELGGDRERIESTLNRFNLWRLFDHGDSGEEHSAAIAVAQAIAGCWRIRLREEFPGVDFSVTSESSEDGPVIQFMAVRGQDRDATS
ncbi:hypothetical protein [Kitasatospora sp. P5_F3]